MIKKGKAFLKDEIHKKVIIINNLNIIDDDFKSKIDKLVENDEIIIIKNEIKKYYEFTKLIKKI